MTDYIIQIQQLNTDMSNDVKLAPRYRIYHPPSEVRQGNRGPTANVEQHSDGWVLEQSCLALH